jgi:DNA-binding NarL/FixJ family response regulator
MASASAKAKVNSRIRVLLADDHTAIRRRVRSILEQHPRFEEIGEAPDGAEAIERAQKPDVVVLNVNMRVLNGLEAAREIKAKLPQSAIVILSVNADKRPHG